MKEAAIVFLAGGTGSVARWLVGVLAVRAWGTAFPFGTLSVNVVGSFAMAIVVGLAGRGMPEALRLALATGLLGGFTTYSSFNQETFAMWQTEGAGRALGYIAITIVGCLLAALAGRQLLSFAR